MSQQHGVSASLASIEAAPPIHGTQATSTVSHSYPSTSSSSSTASQNSASRRSGTTSTRVHIPKLSAATTELLARLAGNVKGTGQQVLPGDDQTRASGSPFPLNPGHNIQSQGSRRAGTMRASSTLIELPTPPFVYPARVEAPPSPVPAPLLSSTSLNRNSVKPNGVSNIAPKPAVASSTSSSAGPQAPLPAHLSLDQPPSSINSNGIPAKPVDIGPKPSATSSLSTAVPANLQVPVNTQTPAGHQPLFTNSTNDTSNLQRSIGDNTKQAVASNTVSVDGHEQVHGQLSSNQPHLSNATSATPARPDTTINIAPKPTKASTNSTLTAGPESSNATQPPPVQPSLPPPIVPLARAPTILKFPSKSLAKPSPTIAGKVPSILHQKRSAGTRKSDSRKRKRGHSRDGEDVIRAVDSSSDESDVTPTATQTISGRQVKRPSVYVPSPLSPAISKDGNNLAGAAQKPTEATKPRKRVPRKGKNTNITCTHCQRGHSLSTNTIVFCDSCNRAWHQYCHDPPIGSEVITVKEKEWLCQGCKPVDITVSHPTVVRSDPSLTTKPPVHPPMVVPKAEVGAEHYSTDHRRRFLSTLSHATLVELLLTISERNPAVPMFPGNLGALPLSNFVPTEAILTANADSASSLPSASANLPQSDPVHSSINAGQDRVDQSLAPEAPRNNQREESSDDDSEYEFQEHRLYPRTGNGVRLSNNEEDLDILQEDPACTTFSHALHAPAPGVVGNISA